MTIQLGKRVYVRTLQFCAAHTWTLFEREVHHLLPDSRLLQPGPDYVPITQAERALHPLGRRHLLFGSHANQGSHASQGSHAVRRAGLIMDLLLESSPMDHKYGCEYPTLLSSVIEWS
jgi:hypothetical protein